MQIDNTQSELDIERLHYDELYSNSDVTEPIPEHIFPEKEHALWRLHAGPLFGKRVLECGCGDGRVSAWLAQQGAYVVGTELSPTGVQKTLERAKWHGFQDRVEANCVDCTCLEKVIAPDSIDVALGWSVLHHLPPKEFGQSLARVLKPGGHGLFFENSNANPVYRLGRRICNNESACGSPLTTKEADTFIAAVGSGERIYPRFGLFRFTKKYVFRDSRFFADLVEGIDNAIDAIPASRRWSGHMWVYARKAAR